jgi:hypothetical protein
MDENRVRRVHTKLKMMLLPIILVLPFFALYAQHGTSPDGLDTWTGQITVLNPDSQEITLTAKKASEVFILPKEEVKPGEKRHKAQFSDLSVGQYVRSVYLRMKQQINGKWVKANTILTIEEVAPRKGS